MSQKIAVSSRAITFPCQGCGLEVKVDLVPARHSAAGLSTPFIPAARDAEETDSGAGHAGE